MISHDFGMKMSYEMEFALVRLSFGSYPIDHGLQFCCVLGQKVATEMNCNLVGYACQLDLSSFKRSQVSLFEEFSTTSPSIIEDMKRHRASEIRIICAMTMRQSSYLLND